MLVGVEKAVCVCISNTPPQTFKKVCLLLSNNVVVIVHKMMDLNSSSGNKLPVVAVVAEVHLVQKQ